ncbi:hypothetical protein GF366_05025 [Candidatus Peregrinibacteria bacterium]|nr:hypothetical protein [Candidatus Peregrinibacteria bacterium]
MIQKNLKSKIIFLLAVLFVLSSSVYAGTPKFNFLSQDSSSGYVYKANPGDEVANDFILANLDSERSITMSLYTSEIFLEDDQKVLPEDWWNFKPSERIKLDPGEQEDVSFVVNIPRDAEPGEYKLGLRTKLVDYEGRNRGAVTMSTAIGHVFIVDVLPIETVESEGVDYEEDVAKAYNLKDSYRYILDGVFLILVILLIWRVYTLEKIVKGKKKRKK